MCPLSRARSFRPAGVLAGGNRIDLAHADAGSGAALRNPRRRHAGAVPGVGLCRACGVKGVQGGVHAGSHHRLSEPRGRRPADRIRRAGTERNRIRGRRIGGRIHPRQSADGDRGRDGSEGGRRRCGGAESTDAQGAYNAR